MTRGPLDEGILLYALRYALGRQTHAPGEVQAAIRRALPIRDAGVREAMIRDIDDAYARVRAEPESRALGHPAIDAFGWISLLEDLKRTVEP